MYKWIKTAVDHAPIAALVVSIASAAISVYAVHQGNVNSINLQNRQASIDAIGGFDSSGHDIVVAAGSFITAINQAKDLSGPKEKIREVTAQRILATTNLIQRYPSKTILVDYEDALQSFNKVAQKTNSADEMDEWVKTFDKVINTQNEVSKDLRFNLESAS